MELDYVECVSCCDCSARTPIDIIIHYPDIFINDLCIECNEELFIKK